MKNITYILAALLLSLGVNAQIIVLDPGHGYGSTTSNNPDGRTATEIETALAVGQKTKALINGSCTWTAYLTRTKNVNGWISVNQRAQMSNNWNADRLVSIHCNAGGGTGTETFYCTADDPTTAPDIAFAQKIQSNMVTQGSWSNRRCVEDNSYLGYHLGVLRYSTATGCLNEIGFVDNTNDAAKLNNDSWRNNFALAYFNALKADLNLSCSTSAPGSFTLSATATCSGSQSAINLTWTTSAGATSYDIYRNGSLYAQNITGTSFLNTYLINPGSTYSYYVKAKNATGSINNSNGTVSKTAVSCASATSIETENLLIYPNPNDGKFTFRVANTENADVYYTISNSSGKIVESRVISAKSASLETYIDISAQPPGIYILNVTAGRSNFSKKIIKK